MKGKRGGAKRRSTEGLPPVNRQYIIGLIEKVDRLHYDDVWKRWVKALIALLYLSGRRISEILGRKYPERGPPVDIYEGVKMKSFSVVNVAGRKVLKMHCRILKKGRLKIVCPQCRKLNSKDARFCSDCGLELAPLNIEELEKGGIRQVWADIPMRLKDPLMKYVLDWLTFLQRNNHVGRVFPITSRQRAWQIMIEIDPNIWNHWLRHQRFTHVSETMDPYELKEFAKWETIEPAVDYVHRSVKRILEKTEKADKIWEG